MIGSSVAPAGFDLTTFVGGLSARGKVR